MEEYLAEARGLIGGVGHTEDQMLAILHWHNYSPADALADVLNYRPHPDIQPEWTAEDIAGFEQAFAQHGKKFHKIARRVRSPAVPG